jgi:hypothetical protein
MENESILELTEENLIKCGFDSEQIERLLSQGNKVSLTNKAKTFLASNIDNKIYTIIEAHRKEYFKNKLDPEFPVHCLGLIPEYYELAESYYLKASKKRLTLIYDEKLQKETFKQEELQRCDDAIDWHFKQPINHPIRHRPHPVIAGKQAYKVWLEREQKREPIDKSELINELLEPKYILGLNEIQISKSYKYFESHFEPLLTYKNYLDCFDETQTPKHPKLINGQNKYFIHFLTMAGANDKIAKERFGIKQFDNTKSRNKTDMKTETVFVNQMKAILNK